MRAPPLIDAIVVAAALALVLAACESVQDSEPAPAAAVETELPAADDPVPEESVGEDPMDALLEDPAYTILPPEPQIDDNPDRLMGLDRIGIDSLLGRPDLIRREPPAEIWQYRGESCVFDVFLYEQAGNTRVTYLEARDPTARRIEARGCLYELLRARLEEPLG